MPIEPISILTLIKGISGALSTARAAGATREWLFAGPSTPLARAVKKTISEFEPRLPDIKRQLQSFLESKSTQEALAKISQTPPKDLSSVVHELVRTTDLYFADPNETKETAIAILTFLIEAFDEEQLRGPESELYADRKQSLRHQELLHEFTQLKANAPSIRLKSRIELTKQATKSLPPAEARTLWLDVEREVEAEKDPDPDLRAQVQTELASCAWSMGDTEEARRRLYNAYKFNPDDQKTRINRALALTIENKPEQAIQILDTVLGATPKNQKALSVKALALARIDHQRRDHRVATDR